MFQELRDGAPQRGLAEEDQLRQALALDGPHPTFRKGICMSLQMRRIGMLRSSLSE